MALLKTYVVFMWLLATVLTCELQSTAEEIAAKVAVEEYIENKKLEIVSRYRLQYHVAPPVGWMNDPNGFSYFKGNYHLFYQFYPYDSIPGKMYWGHVISPNLVDWIQMPIALLPETEQIFSGSAIEVGGTLVLMYTGHIAVSATSHNESQYLAFSNDGIVFNKYKNNPVIPSSPNNSPDFRDPKVWKHGDYYYAVLGSKTDQGYGRVLLYRSPDLGSWEFASELGASTGSMGDMWECPDFFELNKKFILLMSPQGMAEDGDRYKNTYQTGYIIGSFDYQTNKFVQEVSFQEIDYGHDFYATQTLEKDGKRYLIAWFGMWEVDHPEDVDGWAGAMTIFRELTLNGSRILMKPIDAMTTLRESRVYNASLASSASITFDKTGELIVSGNLGQNIDLEISSGGTVLMNIQWDSGVKKVIVNRAGDIRQGAWTPISSQSWRIFLDASSMELFCGEGEVVFSSRIYPAGALVVKNQSAQSLHVLAYTLRKSVPA